MIHTALVYQVKSVPCSVFHQKTYFGALVRLLFHGLLPSTSTAAATTMGLYRRARVRGAASCEGSITFMITFVFTFIRIVIIRIVDQIKKKTQNPKHDPKLKLSPS